MKDFINVARDKASKPGAPVDPSAAEWANRAFAVIAIAGGLDGVSDDVAESLAECLAKAPTETLTGGLVFLMAAEAEAQRLGL